MKKVLAIGISALVFIAGLGLMFYPTFSNWMHAQNASYAISNYIDQVSAKSSDEYEAEFAAARAYNATLSGNVTSFSDAQQDDVPNPDYWETFDQVDGIMGIIEIPSINVALPIYHGTDETVLQKGTGHLEGSALPTGDVGNHTVITGHTGLPTAELFTDLDEMQLGDYFYLEILDQVFVYQVSNIYVVLPSETEQLTAQADKDLVTLVTCTPYGVNSHRLLVQGERVDNPTIAALLTSADAEAVPLSAATGTSSLTVLTTAAICCGVLFIMTLGLCLVRGTYKPKRVVEKTPQTPENNP